MSIQVIKVQVPGPQGPTGALPTETVIADAGAAQAVSATTHKVVAMTITEDCTISFSDVPTTAVAVVTLELTNAGAHTITLTDVSVMEKTWPTLTESGIDALTLYHRPGATNWRLVGISQDVGAVA